MMCEPSFDTLKEQTDTSIDKAFPAVNATLAF